MVKHFCDRCEEEGPEAELAPVSVTIRSYTCYVGIVCEACEERLRVAVGEWETLEGERLYEELPIQLRGYHKDKHERTLM